jgi:hypothetical protein
MATKTVNEITINNIRIGGKAPKKIMKGSTEVKEVKKGSTVVYKKEDVTYTLTSNSPTASASATTITFTIQSYKGSSTSVKPSATVISGGGSIASITAGSGTSWNIVVNISANTTTSSKTHQIGVSQPGADGIGVQSISPTGTQSGKNTATYKVIYNFCNWLYGSTINSASFDFVLKNGNVLVSSIGGGINGVSAGWVTQRTITFSDTSSFMGSLEQLSQFNMLNSNSSGGYWGDWWQIKVTTTSGQPSSQYDGTQIFYGVGVNESTYYSAISMYDVPSSGAGTLRYMWLCQS